VSKDQIFAYQVKDGKEAEKEIFIEEIKILLSDFYA